MEQQINNQFASQLTPQLPKSKTVKPFWAVILLVLVLALIGVLVWQKNNANQNNKNEIVTGTIEGSLSFPSEGIPASLKTCAENILTKQNYCTSERIKDNKFQYGVGYSIEVPAGKYYVYSEFNSSKAYYSEFVTCGVKAGCSSHKIIEVVVDEGQFINNIDPGDWYVER